MENISKDKAIEIAMQYLAKQIHGKLDIIEKISGPTYGANPEDCYCIHVSDSEYRVGASRIICISKFTGKIAFDGTVGE